MVKAKIIYQDTKRVYFEATFPELPEQLTKVVEQLQGTAGYPIQGYGWPMDISTEIVLDGYKVNWKCPSSCD